MTIKIDVKPFFLESAYVERPFDKAKSELESNGYGIISLKQFADLRIAQGKYSHVANYGAYAREGFLYVPQKGIFLARKSPIMTNTKKATSYHRNENEFYLNSEQVEESLGKVGVDSVQFKSERILAIPTNRFGEDERTVFAFGESAKAYGDFLKDAKIFEMPIYLAGLENKPFADQAWLHGLDKVYLSALEGNYMGLNCGNSVRGIRDVNFGGEN